MPWLTVAFAMSAAACLTLAAVHLLVWSRQPARRAHLAFAVTAVSYAALTPFELWMARAHTPAEFGWAIRWVHLPGTLATVALVWFLWLHFGTGRLWLACAACGVRILAMILNFSLPLNLNYQAITGLREVTLFGGERVSSAVGVVSPWALIGQLANLLLLLYVLDATVKLWRRGGHSERRRAAIVGGSLVFESLTVNGNIALVMAGLVDWPLFLSFPFLVTVLAMSFELSLDVVEAGQLSLAVKAKEERLTLAQEASKRDERALQSLTGRLLMLQDEERKRVAAELHDGLGQSLAIIKNRAAIALRDQTDQDRILEQLTEIQTTATSAILDVRQIAHNLRPYELDRLGLVAAIESMVERISDSSSITLSADLEPIAGLLSPEAETSVYRIVQEGLNNVIKHSHAAAARVEIKKRGTQLVVSVQDNGNGMPEPASAGNGNNAGGFGLVGIAERVRTLNGTLAINSLPARGTTLTICLEIPGGTGE